MKISIITAVFNRKNTISIALNSIISQEYKNVELIIQDGGSTDGTLAEIEKFESFNLKLISEPDNGIYDAINRGISRAEGDVIGLMHSDDFFPHEKVLSLVASAFGDPEIDGVYGDLEYVSSVAPNKVIRYWRAGAYDPRKLRWGWMPPHPTLYLRKSVFNRLGLYDTSLEIAADYDAVLRFLILGNIRLAYIPQVLVKMRAGGASNGSIWKIILKSNEDFIAIRRNRVGGFGTLALKNIVKASQFFVKKGRGTV